MICSTGDELEEKLIRPAKGASVLSGSIDNEVALMELWAECRKAGKW